MNPVSLLIRRFVCGSPRLPPPVIPTSLPMLPPPPSLVSWQLYIVDAFGAANSARKGSRTPYSEEEKEKEERDTDPADADADATAGAGCGVRRLWALVSIISVQCRYTSTLLTHSLHHNLASAVVHGTAVLEGLESHTTRPLFPKAVPWKAAPDRSRSAAIARAGGNRDRTP